MSENIDPQIKKWIDGASYHELLQKWRYAPSGSPYFQGETGDYYSDVMARKRKEVGNAAHVQASKAIGWD